MANDIQNYEDAPGAVTPAAGASQMLATIAAAAADPSVDAGKMQALADLAIKLQTHEQQQQFNRDLNAAIMEMPVITKEGRIVIPANRDKGTPERQQGRFARYEDIDRVIKPIAARHNLAYRFEVGSLPNGMITIRPIISHANGHVERGDAFPLPLETSGSKNNVQGAGSSVTYGKRYALCAAFNIVTEGIDDDGRGGVKDVEMPQERASLVLDDAEAAFAAGAYEDWFRKQGPKDRSWLATLGHHARFTGQPQLAAPAGNDAVTPRREDPPPPEAGGGPSPLEQRVQAYEADVAACPSLEALANLQLQRSEWVEQVKAKRPELGERIIAANTRRHAELSSSRNHDDSGTATDLFNEGA